MPFGSVSPCLHEHFKGNFLQQMGMQILPAEESLTSD